MIILITIFSVFYTVERSQVEKPPRVGLDDCCGYCERYREGAITPHRRMEIGTYNKTSLIRSNVSNLLEEVTAQRIIRGKIT